MHESHTPRLVTPAGKPIDWLVPTGLPPGVGAAAMARFLRAAVAQVGERWVLQDATDRGAYLDLYAPGDESLHAAAAAVAPGTVEEIQAVVRLANEFRMERRRHEVPVFDDHRTTAVLGEPTRGRGPSEGFGMRRRPLAT